MRSELKTSTVPAAQAIGGPNEHATPPHGQDSPARLLTLQQVAAYLQLSTKSVRRLRMPCLRIGRAIRYRPSDVERFLAARRFHA